MTLNILTSSNKCNFLKQQYTGTFFLKEEFNPTLLVSARNKCNVM